MHGHTYIKYIFTDFDITNKIARAVKHVLLEVLLQLPCVPSHLAEIHIIHNKFVNELHYQ